MNPVAVIKTPFGIWGIEERNNAVSRLLWNAEPRGELSDLLREAVAQIEAYVGGGLQKFDLPLAPKGSDFQQKVYAAMLAIPYGETLTYGEIAQSLNVPAQPVGQACGANPIPIIIPCHRVLAKNSIGGFSGWGGVEGKIALLKFEGGFPYLI